MMWEDGYSQTEIAETMEISPAQVGSEMTQGCAVRAGICRRDVER